MGRSTVLTQEFCRVISKINSHEEVKRGVYMCTSSSLGKNRKETAGVSVGDKRAGVDQALSG